MHGTVAAAPDADGPTRLEGRVIGPDGQAVGGAVVVLEATSSRTATTAADGQFSFEQLEPHTYWVFASAGALVASPISHVVSTSTQPLTIQLAEAAFATAMVTDEAAQAIKGAHVYMRSGPLTSTTQTDASGRVTLGPMPVGAVRIEVDAVGYAPAVTSIASRSGTRDETTIVLSRGVPITGRVADENHDPIANARITALSRTPVLSNDQGEFVIRALARGNYMLRVEADEHAPMMWGELKVADTPINGIVIVMKDGGLVSGVVLDHTRRPAPFATILRFGGESLTTADHDGAFKLRGLARGHLSLYADTARATSEVIMINLAEKPAADVELVLALDGAITGTVVDEHGDALAGIFVTAVFDHTGVSVGRRLSAANREAITDGDGRFVLQRLPELPVRLAAKRRRTDRMPLRSRQTIAQVGDRDVQIKLVSDGQLIGRVVVDHADAPPRNVTIYMGTRVNAATANREGAFQISEVPPGTYDVVFYSPDFTVFGKRDVQIHAGATTDLGTVTAMRGRTLVGRVIDSSGAPVGIAQIDIGVVRLVPMNDEELSGGFRLYRTVIAKRDGTFSVELPPEPLTAFASDPDYGRSAAVDIAGSTSAPPSITLVLPDADNF